VLSEEEVYNGAKRWLRKNGFKILAGQPARGVDHLPVIEIKQPTGDKGSHYSFKPDLVAYKEGTFYIIECKPEFNYDDYLKIVSILSSDLRINNFYNELKQYKLLERINYTKGISEFKEAIKGLLAFSGNFGPEIDMNKLIVSSWQGSAEWY
jgi:hypothetical protein